jgi:hypothetical protein
VCAKACGQLNRRSKEIVILFDRFACGSADSHLECDVQNLLARACPIRAESELRIALRSLPKRMTP